MSGTALTVFRRNPLYLQRHALVVLYPVATIQKFGDMIMVYLVCKERCHPGCELHSIPVLHFTNKISRKKEQGGRNEEDCKDAMETTNPESSG